MDTKIRVYVVDDERSVCETIQAILASAGIEASYSTNSAEAYELLRKEKYDAVFLDVLMPEPDGIALTRRLRSGGFNQKTPIVIITGAGDPAILKRGFEAGANYFLFKPFDRQGLLRLVRASLAYLEREKRRFQRVPVQRPVTLTWREQKIEGHTVDLSLGGLMMQATSRMPEGLPVEVALWLPSGKPVRARGKIIRSRPDNRMGVEFIGLGTTDAERLQEYLLPLILAEEGEKKPS